MVDRFKYNVGVPAEDLERYVPGGYHPIHINDRLKDGRYEILNKLGFGASSTVWLAKDHQNHRNVSIKVVVADKSTLQIGELEILRHIGTHGDPQHPGRNHVIDLLDTFHHTGPNGQHLCVVLELLGPNVSSVAEDSLHYRLDGHVARKISRQSLLAVDFLHSCGVAHGDIHMGNILFRLSESDKTTSELSLIVGTPQIGKVSRQDGAPLESGLPAYLVEPFEYETNKMENRDEVQLVDFGESFFVTEPPVALCTPMSMHPPELVFHRTLSKAVDIWNLGSTTFELVTGRTPFEAGFNDRGLIPQFQSVLGAIPDGWNSDAVRDGLLKEVPDTSICVFPTLEDDIRSFYSMGRDASAHQLTTEDFNKLAAYLRRTLVMDPEQRAKSHELLSESWVSEAC